MTYKWLSYIDVHILYLHTSSTLSQVLPKEDEPCLIYIWFGYLPWWTVGKMKYLQHSSSFTVSPPSNQTPIQLHQSVIQMILVYQTYRKETKMVNCVRSKKQPKQSLTGKTKLLLQHFNQMNFHNTQANVVDFAGIFPPRKHSLSSQHTSNTSSTSSTHTHTPSKTSCKHTSNNIPRGSM